MVAGAAALDGGQDYTQPGPELLQGLAQSLVDHDDVDPLTRLV